MWCGCVKNIMACFIMWSSCVKNIMACVTSCGDNFRSQGLIGYNLITFTEIHITKKIKQDKFN